MEIYHRVGESLVPVENSDLTSDLETSYAVDSFSLFIVNNMSTKVKGRKDIEILTMPFIGEIPLSYRKYKGLFALLNKRHEVREIVVQEKNGNNINEAFRVVRTNLEFVLGKDNKVMMFTSSNVGSGKTFISTNLAITCLYQAVTAVATARHLGLP